jgi:hypothetical protein
MKWQDLVWVFFMTWQWTLGPRIAGKALHGANDDVLWKSEESDTLSYTVAHLPCSTARERGY